MASLRLALTSKYFGFGGADDHVVLDGGRAVGRIMLHPEGSPERPWFWTITAPEMTPSVDNRGYSATREAAMADFQARWAGSHAIES